MDIDIKAMLQGLGYTRLYCKFSLDEADKKKDIEETFCLKARAVNGLRNKGINTVYDLISSITCKDDLMGFERLGELSAKEIMNALYNYQIEKNDANNLPPLTGFVAHGRRL